MNEVAQSGERLETSGTVRHPRWYRHHCVIECDDTSNLALSRLTIDGREFNTIRSRPGRHEEPKGMKLQPEVLYSQYRVSLPNKARLDAVERPMQNAARSRMGGPAMLQRDVAAQLEPAAFQPATRAHVPAPASPGVSPRPLPSPSSPKQPSKQTAPPAPRPSNLASPSGIDQLQPRGHLAASRSPSPRPSPSRPESMQGLMKDAEQLLRTTGGTGIPTSNSLQGVLQHVEQHLQTTGGTGIPTSGMSNVTYHSEGDASAAGDSHLHIHLHVNQPSSPPPPPAPAPAPVPQAAPEPVKAAPRWKANASGGEDSSDEDLE